MKSEAKKVYSFRLPEYTIQQIEALRGIVSFSYHKKPSAADIVRRAVYEYYQANAPTKKT